MEYIVEAKKLTKIYNTAAETTIALRDVSLRVKKGESVAIVGKSGSGKSTLMHVLATLDQPTSGSFFIDGIDVSSFSSKELDRLRNEKFGFVFQQFFLNGRNTCLENVCLPLMIAGVNTKERKQHGLEMLEAVGLGDKAKQKANDLSGGQKQRLVIARALINNPELIFADEPTGNLDTENGRLIMDLLFKLKNTRGITLIIVTHDPDLAALCERQIQVSDGEIREKIQ